MLLQGRAEALRVRVLLGAACLAYVPRCLIKVRTTSGLLCRALRSMAGGARSVKFASAIVPVLEVLSGGGLRHTESWWSNCLHIFGSSRFPEFD